MSKPVPEYIAELGSAATEAYLHGRCQGKLEDARAALKQIATSKNISNMKMARAIAEQAYKSTTPDQL